MRARNSHCKRKEITAFAATWMDLEIIMLSEVSQTMRPQHHMLSHVESKKRTGTDLQTLKNLCFPNETGLGVWEVHWGFGMEML